MKKFYFCMMMSLIGLTACSNFTPSKDKKIHKKFVKVNTSELGLENSKNKDELHISYDKNSKKEKEYQQLQEIEKDNERYQDKEFRAFIREQDKTQGR